MDLKETKLNECSYRESRRHPWEQARLYFLRSWLSSLDLADGAVLDVGCGDAYLLSNLAATSRREHFGVDTAYRDEERPSTPENVRLFSELESVPSQAGIAVILLMDVLEHLQNPVRLLTELRDLQLLKPATKVIVTVPAFPILFSMHDDYLGHYRRYTSTTLRNQLMQAGLSSQREGYLFTSLMVVRAFQCLSEKFLRRSKEFKGVALWQQPELITKILLQCLIWDGLANQLAKRFLGLSLPGLSCYCIASLGINARDGRS